MKKQGQYTDLDNLLQIDVQNEVIPKLGKSHWQAVYTIRDTAESQWGLYSALVDDAHLAQVLQIDTWDLHMSKGLPGFSQSYTDGTAITTYHRYNTDNGIRPLVVVRDFQGCFPDYPEICEEFRHLHNLAHDSKRGMLIDYDKSGYEVEAARLKPKSVEIRLDYLKRFLAAVGLNLVIYFDSVRYSHVPISQVPPERQLLECRDETSSLRFDVQKSDFVTEFETFSRLSGKVIVPPPPVEQSEFWPFEEKDTREVDFIIGTDAEGRPVSSASNPDKLANNFGANPEAAHYLTPVWFRREVLVKYYADSARYAISDGLLRCGNLWTVQIDNNHPTHIAVFLGDLGRDLPYDERLHWKQYNVPPEGAVSTVNFQHSFLAEFAEPTAPDLIFKTNYRRLNRDWFAARGWALFLPPEEEDEHLLRTLRIPVTNSQAELDDQVLALTKLLVDALNEKEIVHVAGPGQPGERGISKFKHFLIKEDFPQHQQAVQFLRDLQELRSAGSGHRKGSEYRAIVERLGIDLANKPEAMRWLLNRAAEMLEVLHPARVLSQPKSPVGANS